MGKSATKSFTITNNNNNGQSLIISSISRPNAPASVLDFRPANVSTPPPIPPSESTSFSVSFVPSGHGDRQTVYTAKDSNGATDSVTVRGRGIERRLSMDRSSVSFGDQRVGTRSPTQSLTLTNTGGDPVTVTSLARSGANGSDFRASGPSASFTISPGAIATVSIAFQPAGGGLRTGSLSIVYSNQWCSAVSLGVSLVGSGVVPNISLDPNPVDVGASPKGVASKPTAITLSNDGKAALKITAVQVLGTDAADFALTGLPTMPVIVPAGGTLVFSVRMTPSEEGARTATINVISDDPDAPAFSVLLRGSGGAGSPSPTPSRSPSVSPSAKPSATTSPQAIGKPSNDSLAVGLVVGGVIAAFGGLMVIRRLVAAPDED